METPKVDPRIGMTAEEVRNSTWGSADKINRDTYAWGTEEQWCYTNGVGKQGYIYFENGIVVAIQER